MHARRLRLTALLLGATATAGAGPGPPPSVRLLLSGDALSAYGGISRTENDIMFTDAPQAAPPLSLADFVWSFASIVNHSDAAGTVTWGMHHNYNIHAIASNVFAQTTVFGAGEGAHASVHLPSTLHSTYVDPHTAARMSVPIRAGDTLQFYAILSSATADFRVSLSATAYFGPRWVPPAPAKPATAATGYEQHAVSVTYVPVVVESAAYAVLGYVSALTPRPGDARAQTMPASYAPAFVFAGLVNGAYYVASVASSNVFGATPSPASAPALVVGVPYRPSFKPIVTAGGSSVATVTIAPSGNGGASIDAFSVSYSDNLGVTWTMIVGTFPTFTLVNLRIGALCYVTGKVSNDGGVSWSEPSLRWEFNTYTTPSRIAAWSVAPTAAYCALATFVPPAANGASISSYRLHDVGTGSNYYSAGAAPSVTTSNLEPGSAHAFVAYATNFAGESAASDASPYVVVSDVPDAPLAWGVTYATSNVLAVAIAPPSSNCATILSYSVTEVVGPTPGSVTTHPVSPGQGVSYLMSGLTLGATYAFVAHASNASGLGRASALSACNVPYAPPVVLAWTAQPYITSVNVVVNAYLENGRPVTSWAASNLTTGAPETVTFSGNMMIAIDGGKLYRFFVRGSNAAGWGPSSQTLLTLAGPVPEKITGLSATAGACNVTITVAAQPGIVLPELPVQAYTVQSLEFGPGPIVPMPLAYATWAPLVDTNTTASSVVIPGLVPGVALSFTAMASNARGTSSNSAPVGPVTPYTVPATVADWTVTNATSNVLAVEIAPPFWNWSPVAGYRVTECVGDAGATFYSATSDWTLSVADGLALGVPYAFTASACNAAGWGAESAPSACNVLYVPPSAVAAWTLVPGDRCATVTVEPPFWGGSPILAYGASNLTTGAITSSNVGRVVVVDGLVNGVMYALTPAASNAAGWGPWLASAACNVTPRTVPDPVVAWTVDYASPPSQLVVDITPPAFDGGAPIVAYVASEVVGDAVGATFVSAAPRFALSNLTLGVEVAFVCAASNAAGRGAWSAASAALTPYDRPDVVSSWALVPDAGRAIATIAPPTFDGGRPVLRYGVSNAATGITTSNGPVLVVGGLANGVPYTMWAAASNAFGWCAYASPRAVTPRTVPDPVPAFAVVADILAIGFTVTPPAYDGGAPVLAYQAVESVTQNLRDPYAPIAHSPTFAVTGLSPDVTYQFKVRSCNAAGWSAMSATTSPQLQPFTKPDAIPSERWRIEARKPSTMYADITFPAMHGRPVDAVRVSLVSQQLYDGATGTLGAVDATVAHAAFLSYGGINSFDLPDFYATGRYVFTVAVSNIGGWSPESGPNSANAYGRPGVIDAWTIALAGTNVARATIVVPPFDFLSPVLRYGITEVTTGASNVYTSWTTDVRSSALVYGPTYYFIAAASNAAGWGPYSAVNPAGVHPYKEPDTMLTGSAFYGFASNTFTPMGALGRVGPPAGATPAAYSWPWNSYMFGVSESGVQSWVVPRTGTYRFDVRGASSGALASAPTRVGRGMGLSGDVRLTLGDVLLFVVGQRGEDSSNAPGGGGGTFVFLNYINPYSYLFVAGGGGAPGNASPPSADTAFMDASATVAGNAGSNVGDALHPTNAGGAAGVAGAAGAPATLAYLPFAYVSGSRAVTVAFPAVAGVDMHVVATAPTAGAVVAVGLVPPLVVTGLVAGAPYSFYVATSNRAGGLGAWSAPCYATPIVVSPSAANVSPVAVPVSSGAIAVSFAALSSAPSSNPIDAYVVATSPNIAAIVGAGRASPLVVSGLAPGQAYTFRVAASNLVGVGAWSKTCTATALDVPPSAATMAPVATTSSSTEVVVTFPLLTPSATQPITTYALSTWGTRASVCYTSTASPVVLRDLAPGTTYTYYVAASNAAGLGAWSAPCSAFTAIALPVSAASMRPSVSQTNVGELTLTFPPLASSFGQPILAYVVSTAASAATVVAADVAANTLANAVLSNPIFERLAGDVAGAGVAARRMVVLARDGILFLMAWAMTWRGAGSSSSNSSRGWTGACSSSRWGGRQASDGSGSS